MPRDSASEAVHPIIGDRLSGSGAWLRAIATVAGLSLFAAIFAAVLPRLENLSSRRAVAIVVVLTLVGIALACKVLKETVLVVWVVSMSIFRPYQAPGSLLGLEGLYLVPSEILLVGLYGIWAIELVFLKRPLVRYSYPVWPFFIPFVIACTISAAQSTNPSWALADISRLIRIVPIFVYCRYNLGRKEWQLCLGALCLAVLFQVALGVIQVTTRKLLPDDLEGPARAQGMMEHPNILADYLLLMFPAGIAMALAPTRRPLRIIAIAIAAISGLGIVITLSRIPWVLMIGQCLLAGVTLVVLRMLSFKRLVGLGAVALICAILAALPFAQKIQDRLQGDFKDSIRFRSELNAVALRVFENNPFIGVGLNNLSLHLISIASKYGYHDLLFSQQDWREGEADAMIRRVTVHNLYLFMLAETGLLGLLALLLYLLSAAAAGIYAVSVSRGTLRAASAGLTIGIIGVMLHNLGEIALWFEPVMHSFALVFMMAAVAPSLVRTHGDDWLGQIEFPDWMLRGRSARRTINSHA
jgi:putative inorganic carbon (hco3(-)) transporter